MPGDVKLPLLTIVIPNHNYEKWITEAIASAALDPYPNKQVVVIDDGSTDGSWEKICNFIFKKKIIPQPKQLYAGKIMNTPVFAAHLEKALGPSGARNTGAQIFWNDTDIYGFLDADDVYLPGKINKSIEKFLQDPVRIGAVYTDYDTLNIDTGTRMRVYKEPFNINRLMQECIIHSACLVSKLALEQCGIYDENMRTCEDYDLWLRISKAFVFVHIPEPLMLVRVGSHNSSATVDKTIWQQNWQKIRSKYNGTVAR
jgi:glycosyltransferase involved in cell wall biosynthesis